MSKKSERLELIISARDGASKTIRTLTGSITSLTGRVLNLKTAAVTLLGTYGLKRVGDSFLETAANAEKMQLSLDTITKGRGQEWFDRLNEWALKMPVNTAKAVQSYTMLRAMGLEPTIEDMTTLVDTTSALGGSEDTLEGIARALGQIVTKGKVSAEELMQLAERGVPAYQILKEELNLTADQVANIGKEGVDANKAVQALLRGMQERFGGQSEKMQSIWAGLTESARSYYKEFQRLVMDSGPMKVMERILGNIVKKMDEWKASGQLNEWANQTASVALETFKKIIIGAGTVGDAIASVWSVSSKAVGSLWDTFKSMPQWAQAGGIVGALMLGKSSVIVIPAMLTLIQSVKDSLKLYAYIKEGKLNWSDIWGKPAEEQKELVAKLEQLSNGTIIEDLNMPDIDTSTWKGKAQELAAYIDTVIAGIKKQVELDEALMDDLLYIPESASEATAAVTKTTSSAVRDVTNFYNYAEEMSRQTAKNMHSNMSDLFFDAYKGELDSLKDYFTAFTDSLMRTWSDMVAKMVNEWLYGQSFLQGNSSSVGGILGAIGSAIGSFFNPTTHVASGYALTAEGAVLHGGGMGYESRSFRNVPAAVFAGAPRYHSGIGPGERAAIIRNDEGVFTPGQMKALGEMTGGQTNIFYVQANDAKSFADMCNRNAAAIVKPVLSSLKNNETRTQMKSLLR